MEESLHFFHGNVEMKCVFVHLFQEKVPVEEPRRSATPDRPKTPDMDLEKPAKPSPKRTHAPKPPQEVSLERSVSREGSESPREGSISSRSEGEVSIGKEDIVPAPEKEKTPSPSPEKERPPSQEKERALTPEKDRSMSPAKEKAPSPEKEKAPSPPKSKTPSPRSTPEKDKAPTSIRVSPIPMEPLPDLSEAEVSEQGLKEVS